MVTIIRYIATLTLLIFSVSGWAQNDTAQNAVNQPHFSEDFRITDLVERYSNNLKGKPIDGFRVQLFSGDRDLANQNRKKAISNYPQIPCVLIYETPDFKVQMGNFRTELEAEKHLQIIRQGFPGAFVVRSKINLPELTFSENDEEQN
ncbi:MAG: SPOR domain-containing protein [Schleiferiaceae bacterium]|jgi:hypothetical protein|nr:SPOR domain-containing protein [Schleiferiaceae bacterium]